MRLLAALMLTASLPLRATCVASYPVHAILDVIDGDTVRVDMLVWHDSIQRMRTYKVDELRLYGVNTPELHPKRKEAGRVRTDAELAAIRKSAYVAKLYTTRFLDGCMPRNLTVCVVKRRGKYGRLVGDLLCGRRSLAEALYKTGHAKRVDW